MDVPDHVDLIVTHGGCPDGFTAEWLLHQRWPAARCHQAVYGEDVADLVLFANTGGIRDVGDPGPSVMVMADFSFPLDVMRTLAAVWDRIILLDHHATAVEALDGHLPVNVDAVFDMNRSGAGLVADWLNVRAPESARDEARSRSGFHGLRLVDYIEERDLWRHEGPTPLPNAREIDAVILATPRTYEQWDRLNRRLRMGQIAFDAVVSEGAVILDYRDVLVADIVANPRWKWIGDFHVPVVPSPYALGSQVAGRLAETHHGIGGYYRDLPDRREYGLRSTPDGPNVADLAKWVGDTLRATGGGHPHASGFRVNWDGPDDERHTAAALRVHLLR